MKQVTTNYYEKDTGVATGLLPGPDAPDQGLSPYTGPWTIETANHLLRRTTFGPTYEQAQHSVERGLEDTIEQLLEDLPLPEPPLSSDDTDPNSAKGQTWINAPWSSSRNVRIKQQAARTKSLFGWTVGLMLEEKVSIREKMTLFWHNHLPVRDVIDTRFLYQYITTLRRNALGNFKALMKEMTIDPAMLRYLNGNRNSKGAPNENYARELLELFTIGKGPMVAPGDYTHYTEEDVKEMARILTGWRERGYLKAGGDGKFFSYFELTRHDIGVKQLSHRFGNAKIRDNGAREYSDLIDIIFQQDEVARHICRKLYRWFVDYKLTEEAELSVVAPLARKLIDSNYELKPVLRALLSSDHFFNERNIGLMIKSPIDYVVSLVKPTFVDISQPLDQKYDSWYMLYKAMESMNMIYFKVPEVAGWEAYFREPMYYRNWVTPSTLPVRTQFTSLVLNSGQPAYKANGKRMKIDPLKLVATLPNADDPNEVIRGIGRVLFPMPLSEEMVMALKEILIPGLPDFEWTVEYGDYLQNPNNSQLANSIRAKLKDLLTTMMGMSEFQLS